jgi:hypothetical protein
MFMPLPLHPFSGAQSVKRPDLLSGLSFSPNQILEQELFNGSKQGKESCRADSVARWVIGPLIL